MVKNFKKNFIVMFLIKTLQIIEKEKTHYLQILSLVL